MGSLVIGLKVQSLTSADGAREETGRGGGGAVLERLCGSFLPARPPTISALITDHAPRAPAPSGSAAGSQPCFACALPLHAASAAVLFSSAFFLASLLSPPLRRWRETDRRRVATDGLPLSSPLLLFSEESGSWRPPRRSRRLRTYPGRCPP